MWLVIFALFLGSCGRVGSADDLRSEGEAQVKRLAAELRMVENREDLQRAMPKIKKRFDKIADLLIEARRFPQEERELSGAGDELFLELARLYELPGGREMIESCQTEAVRKLKKFF